MKKQILISLSLLAVLMCGAKDVKTLRVTTQPQMVCNNCENKIKKTLRFEKGIQEISTDLKDQVVTVTYDADKTDEEKIVKAFDKMKYKAIILKGAETSAPADSCCYK